jgi:hypothetical protein
MGSKAWWQPAQKATEVCCAYRARVVGVALVAAGGNGGITAGTGGGCKHSSFRITATPRKTGELVAS